MNLCCIFNYAPHYRLPIYKIIDKELGAHFYFGDKLYKSEQIEKLDFNQLSGFQKELKTHFVQCGKFIVEYTSGWISLALKFKYKNYIITPNPFSINQWLFLILCFISRKKVYAWMHGIRDVNISIKSLFFMRMYDYFLKGTFLYGNHAKRNMVSLGFKENKLHVIYNSLNYQESKKLRDFKFDNPFDFTNFHPILLFIGRLTKIKKLDMLINAYLLLKRKGLQTNLVFIGDGPEREHLESIISEEDMQHIKFVGSLYEESIIAKYIYHADLCVSPGNVGLTAIHALSYGLPVITNDNFSSQMPEYEAIENGKTGVFFKENDIEDLVQKIESWFKNNSDREFVRKNCYEVIDSKYNPFTQLDILKKVLENESALDY